MIATKVHSLLLNLLHMLGEGGAQHKATVRCNCPIFSMYNMLFLVIMLRYKVILTCVELAVVPHNRLRVCCCAPQPTTRVLLCTTTDYVCVVVVPPQPTTCVLLCPTTDHACDVVPPQLTTCVLLCPKTDHVCIVVPPQLTTCVLLCPHN